jgi:hypothetical protein
MKRVWIVALLLSIGCGPSVPKSQTADARQAAETRVRLAEADRQIGMPDITRFTERKLAKDILELRDKEITTFCYIVNLNGELIFLGEAIGYGIPYSVQYTNPQIVDTVDGGDFGARNPYSMPQADPNGLFMPGESSATWIMLKGPDGKVHPVYMEPQIIVSPFPLHAVATNQAEAAK